MRRGNPPRDPRRTIAPIFILADDDQHAIANLISILDRQWFYIPVADAGEVVRYAKEFATTAIFLAEAMHCSEKGGIPRLLQRLLDEVGRPVIILSESWAAESAEKWKRMGARDCLPHPTRTQERLKSLKRKMKELAAAS